MNGSMLPAVVIRPLARPQAAPMTMASATAKTSIVAGSAITPLFMNMIIRLATNATMEPTDRSKPPADITKVAPTAMMATKALRVMTLRRLSMLMKFGFAIVPGIRRAPGMARRPAGQCPSRISALFGCLLRGQSFLIRCAASPDLTPVASTTISLSFMSSLLSRRRSALTA